jgi:YMGG-like Gly-zipper
MLLVKIAWRHRWLQKLRSGWVSEPPTCLTVRDGWERRGTPALIRCLVSGIALAHAQLDGSCNARARLGSVLISSTMSQTRERCRRYASTKRVDVSKRSVIGIIVGMCMVAMLAVGCGTLTGAAVGAGSGAAIGAAAGDAKKGALIGAGVGAAGGAVYDATR